MQLSGTKQFWMFPLSDSPYLYPSTVGIGGHRSNIATANIVGENVDLHVHPEYLKTTPHRADLRAGELLFLPCDWWHTTVTVGEEHSLSLGGNFVTESNKEAFLSAWRDYQAHVALIKHGAVTFK